jgi:hypothetical protein
MDGRLLSRKTKNDGLSFCEDKKKKKLGGYPMEVECIKGCFGVWK